jgi:hypothetical protein
MALGYADNSILGLSSFGGVPVDTSSLLVGSTYFGDANLDGKVDVKDLYALASHFSTSGDVWTSGDFNYDGLADAVDLALLAKNWQAGVGAPLAMPLETALAAVGLLADAVPEPAGVLLLGCPIALLPYVSRRKRR